MRSLVIQSLLILSAASAVLGIKCYQCNSMWNGKCGEDFRESPTMIVDCDQEMMELFPPLKATFCRKLLQVVYGQVRVVRSCGFVVNKPSKRNKCEYFSFVKATETTYCECNGDLCNGIGKVSVEWKLMSLLATVLVVKHFY